VSTFPDVSNGVAAILPIFTCVELPAPDNTPFAANVTLEFKTVVGAPTKSCLS